MKYNIRTEDSTRCARTWNTLLYKIQATVFWIVTMCNEMAYFIDDFSQENYIAVNPYNATC